MHDNLNTSVALGSMKCISPSHKNTIHVPNVDINSMTYYLQSIEYLLTILGFNKIEIEKIFGKRCLIFDILNN